MNKVVVFVTIQGHSFLSQTGSHILFYFSPFKLLAISLIIWCRFY